MATGVPNIACIKSDAYTDDNFGRMPALPFNVSIFSTVSNRIFVSTNGVSLLLTPSF